MKLVKRIGAVAALGLLTAGVFAGSPKFANDLYVSQTGTAGTFTQIASGATFLELQTATNGSQVNITDHNGATYHLYFAANSTSKVYSTNNW